MSFRQDLSFALRSLARAKGLAATVVVTLALGIGANAAIFSVVRGILLRPLNNQDETRLLYIRQTATGTGAANTSFSVPEIADYRARVHTLTGLGDFSREFGIRLAVGSQPTAILTGVLFRRHHHRRGGGRRRQRHRLRHRPSRPGVDSGTPGRGDLAAHPSAALLLMAAVAASLMPALRASRVDVIQALRAE